MVQTLHFLFFFFLVFLRSFCQFLSKVVVVLCILLLCFSGIVSQHSILGTFQPRGKVFVSWVGSC